MHFDRRNSNFVPKKWKIKRVEGILKHESVPSMKNSYKMAKKQAMSEDLVFFADLFCTRREREVIENDKNY